MQSYIITYNSQPYDRTELFPRTAALPISRLGVGIIEVSIADALM